MKYLRRGMNPQSIQAYNECKAKKSFGNGTCPNFETLRLGIKNLAKT